MPLIIISGIPASGKSTVAEKLKTFFTELKGKLVYVISENEVMDGRGKNPNDIYNTPSSEKEIRGILKAQVLRVLNGKDVIILDALSYNKGYRYELFCAAKNAKTPHCVVHCATSQQQAAVYNTNRPTKHHYNKQIFDNLVSRFEAPNSMARWDSPLFTILPDNELPLDNIYNALYQGKEPTPNLSVLSQPLSHTNFLYDIDQVTDSIANVIFTALRSGTEGEISIPGTSEKYLIAEHSSRIRSMRRQFLNYIKTHPASHKEDIATLFVQYLNTESGAVKK